MKKLEVGDLIYKTHINNTRSVATIERVTEKFAFGGSYKFKRDYEKYVSLAGEKVYSGLYFVPNNDEIQEQIKFNIRRKVKHFNYDILNDETIKKIYDIIKS